MGGVGGGVGSPAHEMLPLLLFVSNVTDVMPFADLNSLLYTLPVKTAGPVGGPSGLSYSGCQTVSTGSACTFQPFEQP